MKILIDISDNDFQSIVEIIKETHLSHNNLIKDDFICIKENNKIIAFWRIYNIWNLDREVWSLWVDENNRWNKIWQKILRFLIENKYNWNNLFLATEKDLEKYYEDIWFKKVNSFPDKFIDEIQFAESIWLEWIVMKYI